jgi:RNA polymerase sigma-70 factor (ECF subfamily)
MDDIDDLHAEAAKGNTDALARLFNSFRPRLRRMVSLRMDRRLQGRVDPSDVLQDAYVDIATAFPTYVQDPQVSLYLWFRYMTGMRLMQVHRHHLGREKRDATREISLYRGSMPHASSLSIARQLLGHASTPDQASLRAELQLQLEEALNRMDVIDREVLVLRHFEELTNKETARTLGISKTAASNRYVRALERLRTIIAGIPGLLDDDMLQKKHGDTPLHSTSPDDGFLV